MVIFIVVVSVEVVELDTVVLDDIVDGVFVVDEAVFVVEIVIELVAFCKSLLLRTDYVVTIAS